MEEKNVNLNQEYSFGPVRAEVEIKEDQKSEKERKKNALKNREEKPENEARDENILVEDREEEEGEEGILPVDIYQTPKDVFIVAPIAGIEPKDVEIIINEDMIIIRGERKREEKKEQDIEYLRQECLWGRFSRKIILPCEIQRDKARASYSKKGILTIKLPKLEKSQTRKIKIEEE